jgi:beta-lactam-binding protein with PASTA domain
VVPKLKGETLAAAKRSINSRGCIVGKITHVASRAVNKGIVLWQAPKEGKWLLKWTKVNLAVSSG